MTIAVLMIRDYGSEFVERNIEVLEDDSRCISYGREILEGEVSGSSLGMSVRMVSKVIYLDF